MPWDPPLSTETPLLAAVGHDFRTPLAAAKAAVSTLLSHDIDEVERAFRVYWEKGATGWACAATW